MRKHTFLVLYGIFLSHILIAQSFNNIIARQQQEKIIIEYDLIAPDNDDTYNISVFSSLDNFTDPLNYVDGDVGGEIKSGKGKKIEWFAEQEKGSYQGPISFELRGQIVRKISVPPIQTSFPAKSKIKRGQKYTINWRGGLSDSRINIDLYQNGEQVETVARNLSNKQEFKWRVPKSKTNGTGFYLVLSDQTYRGNTTDSGHFNVVTPISPMIKATAAIAAIIGVYAIIQSE